MNPDPDKLAALLRSEFPELQHVEMNADSVLVELLGNSSLNLLFLRGIVHENFGAALTDEEIKACRTLADLARLIDEKCR